MTDTKTTDATAISNLAATDVLPIGRPGNATAYKVTPKQLIALDWYNAQMYDIKGDGSTDDADAINALIVLVDGAGGGIIYFPYGTYIVGDVIDIVGAHNIRITGAGIGATKIKFKDGFSKVGQGNSGYMFKVAASTDISFDHMTLDGNSSGISDSYALIGIYRVGENWCQYIDIHDMHFQDSYQDFVYVTGGKDITIHDNTGYHSLRSNYVIINGTRITIADNIGMRAFNSFIDFEPNQPTESITQVALVGNVYIDEEPNDAIGIGLTSDDTHVAIVRDITVEGNIIECSNASFILGYVDNLRAVGNIFKTDGGYGSASIKISACNHIDFSHNYCEYTGTQGGSFTGIWVRDGSTYVALSYNDVINADNKGITIADGNDNRAEYNFVDSAYNDGISQGADRGTCIGNIVLNAGGVGLYVTGDDCKTDDNIVVGSIGYGLRMLYGVRGLISGNTFKNGASIAMRIESSYHTIVNNHCYDDQGTKTQTYGLSLGGADYLTIMGNDLTGNLTGSISGSATNYRPNPDGTFATDMADFNFT